MTKSYLGYLIELLKADDWKGQSEAIEIAKGKYSIPKTWEAFKKQLWR